MGFFDLTQLSCSWSTYNLVLKYVYNWNNQNSGVNCFYSLMRKISLVRLWTPYSFYSESIQFLFYIHPRNPCGQVSRLLAGHEPFPSHRGIEFLITAY